MSCLNRALYPDPPRRRGAEPAAACPPLTGDTVLARPSELAFTVEGIMPGAHRFEGYTVTWWAPSALRLEVPAKFGIRQRELLDKAADPALIAANLRRCDEWQAARAAAIDHGSVASLSVATATARASVTADRVEVELLEVERIADRPFGPRFGALVHAILATAPLDASVVDIAAVAAVQARLLGAAANEEAAAVDVVRAALAHPIVQRARTSAACRRETPLTLLADDGTLVEGTVDLAFLDAGTWVVVDFKTDHELGQRVDTYRRQVSLYADAIATATGQPARGILLRL